MTRKKNNAALIQYTLDILEMTQAELGAEMGMSQPRISALINGRQSFLKRHAMCLETILRREDEWPPPKSLSRPA